MAGDTRVENPTTAPTTIDARHWEDNDTTVNINQGLSDTVAGELLSLAKQGMQSQSVANGMVQSMATSMMNAGAGGASSMDWSGPRNRSTASEASQRAKIEL